MKNYFLQQNFKEITMLRNLVFAAITCIFSFKTLMASEEFDEQPGDTKYSSCYIKFYNVNINFFKDKKLPKFDECENISLYDNRCKESGLMDVFYFKKYSVNITCQGFLDFVQDKINDKFPLVDGVSLVFSEYNFSKQGDKNISVSSKAVLSEIPFKNLFANSPIQLDHLSLKFTNDENFRNNNDSNVSSVISNNNNNNNEE